MQLCFLDQVDTVADRLYFSLNFSLTMLQPEPEFWACYDFHPFPSKFLDDMTLVM
jgi:hypothetical protein